MLAAGSATAVATPSPSAFSPTITDEAPDAEAPAAEAVGESAPTRVGRSDPIDFSRLQQILDNTDRHPPDKPHVGAEHRGASQAPLFDFDPAKIPLPPPPSAAPAPREPDPIFRYTPTGAADPPPQKAAASGWLIGGLVVGAFLLLVGMRWADERPGAIRAQAAHALTAAAAWRRRHSAAFIVIGIAIVAASFTVARPDTLPYEIRDLSRDGWLAFLGALVALTGLYDKIHANPSDRI